MGGRRRQSRRRRGQRRNRRSRRTLYRRAPQHGRCNTRRGGAARMSEEGKVPLPNLEDRAALPEVPVASEAEGSTTRSAADREAVCDVLVKFSAILGRARMEINDL